MLVDAVLQWILQYGYGAIFVLLVLGIVGLPVPDETLLTFTGFLIYKKQLGLIPAFCAALGGSVTGITISYWLGHKFGLSLLHKYGKYIHFDEDRLEKVHYWFERIGKWLLTFGYFIPGVRHFTAYVAGSTGLEPPVFARYAYSGALLWVCTFFTLGYYFGDEWQKLLDLVHENLLHASVAAGVVLLVYAGWRWWNARRKATMK